MPLLNNVIELRAAEYALSTPRTDGKTFLPINGSRSPVKTLTKLNVRRALL